MQTKVEHYHSMKTISLERLLYKLLLLDYIKDDYALEFQNALLKVVMGALFFIVGPTIFTDMNNPIYKYLEYLDPRIWGILLVAMGSSHIYGLIYRSRLLRKNILLAAGVLWLSFGVAFMLGNPVSFLPYICYVLCLSSFRCYLCIQVFSRFSIHDSK